jgi:hypothetical protein
MQHIPDRTAPSQPKERQDSSVSPHLFFLQKRDKKGQVHWRPKTRKRTEFQTQTKKKIYPKKQANLWCSLSQGSSRIIIIAGDSFTSQQRV